MKPLAALAGPAVGIERRPSSIDVGRPPFDDVLERAWSPEDERGREAQDAPRSAMDAPPDRIDVQTTTHPNAAAAAPAPLRVPERDPPPRASATPEIAARGPGRSTASDGPAPVTPAGGAARLGEALEQAVDHGRPSERQTIDAKRLRSRGAAKTSTLTAGAPPTRGNAHSATMLSLAARVVDTSTTIPPPGTAHTASTTAPTSWSPGRDAMVAALSPSSATIIRETTADDDDDGDGDGDSATVIAAAAGGSPRAFEGTWRETGPVQPASTPSAALEQLEALLHDPASGVLLDGRAAVVTIDGLKVRIVTDSQGHTSVRMVAQDAALGASLEQQAASLSAGLERVGLQLDQLQVGRGERPQGDAERSHDHASPQDQQRDSDTNADVDGQRPRRRAGPAAATPTTSTTPAGVVTVRA